MSDRMYCEKCKQATDHRVVDVDWSGQEQPGLVSRLFSGVLTMGLSEFMSERRHECIDCGEQRW